ncbi:MAG: acyl-CoA dehydrogenase family protein [Thermodesulfobacteriota bacterium]|jgi:alkylation response protein AidB-like acyl-CoA dehydrogenase
MEYFLTDEQNMLRKTVQNFLQNECTAEIIREWDKEDKIPDRVLRKLKELGLTRLCIPKEYGGLGNNILDNVVVIEELAKANMALAGHFICYTFYGGEIIKECGSLDQKRRFLPGVAKGELFFSYGVTEPNAGSDATAVCTRAVPSGDKFIINGTKMFISGADIADYVVTLTRTNEQGLRHKGLTLFVVDTKSEGYSCRPLEKLGGKGSNACEVVYDNVVVPQTDILGGPEGLNKGWALLLKTLDLEHIEVAAFALGLAQAPFKESLEYVKFREQFVEPIGKYQAVSHRLAEMAVKIETAKLLVYNCAWLKVNNRPCMTEACMAKLYTTEICRDVAEVGMKIMGIDGYMMKNNMQRYLRDSLLGPIGGGTSEIQKNMIAKMLGL